MVHLKWVNTKLSERLRERERERERGEHKQGEWERKKQAPSGGPDVAHPRTPGSLPEPKADA